MGAIELPVSQSLGTESSNVIIKMCEFVDGYFKQDDGGCVIPAGFQRKPLMPAVYGFLRDGGGRTEDADPETLERGDGFTLDRDFGFEPQAPLQIDARFGGRMDERVRQRVRRQRAAERIGIRKEEVRHAVHHSGAALQPALG